MELITKLGIDWKLLIAQVINFFILLFVLHRFAYRPILKMLKKRTDTIDKSLSDVKQIEKNLAESNQKKDELLRTARQQAHKNDTEGDANQRRGKRRHRSRLRDERGYFGNRP